MGGDVETYWKSTTILAPPSKPSFKLQPVNFAPSLQTSPSAMSTLSTHGQHISTISSLKGEYVRVVVQATRDLHPVVFAEQLIPHIDFDLCVPDITLEQFQSVALRLGRNTELKELPTKASVWSRMLAHAMLPLLQLLKVCLGLCRHAGYHLTRSG